MTPDPIFERIARARLLAERHPGAASLLAFYARLAEYQRSLLSRAPDDTAADHRVLAEIPAFLEWLAREAPAALAETAVELSRLEDADWRVWLSAAFADEPSERPPHDSAALSPHASAALFVVEVLLQPFAERTAAALTVPGATGTGEHAASRCPSCDSAPVVGVLREEGHGARRALVCARCVTEWPSRRVACVACGEGTFDALPVYTAEQFPHIRIDACDRCRRYLKTVDLTRDGLAVPLVDDLASLPLDLWARGEGYVRLRANILRT